MISLQKDLDSCTLLLFLAFLRPPNIPKPRLSVPPQSLGFAKKKPRKPIKNHQFSKEEKPKNHPKQGTPGPQPSPPKAPIARAVEGKTQGPHETFRGSARPGRLYVPKAFELGPKEATRNSSQKVMFGVENLLFQKTQGKPGGNQPKNENKRNHSWGRVYKTTGGKKTSKKNKQHPVKTSQNAFFWCSPPAPPPPRLGAKG